MNEKEDIFSIIDKLRATPTPENINRLISFFSDKTWVVRRAAANAVASLGEAAIPHISQTIFLSPTLDDDTLYWCIRTLGMMGKKGNSILLPLLSNERLTPVYKNYVIRALGDTGDPEIINHIIGCLADPSWSVRNEAGKVLESFGKTVVPYLKKAFMSPNEDVRYWSVRILGSILGREAITYFKKMLESDRKEIRYYAAAALGEIDDEEALEAVTNAFNDDSWLVRAQVAEILERRGKKAIKFLKQIYERGNSDTKYQTIKLMGKIMGREAIDFIGNILDTKETEIKFYALTALAETGLEDVVPIMIRSFRDEAWLVRKHAAGLLERFGERARKELEELLSRSTDENERYWAIFTLGGIRENGPSTLIRLARKFEKKEKIFAIQALKKSLSGEVIEFLFTLLGDENWPVRNEASKVLREAETSLLKEPVLRYVLSQNADIRYWTGQIIKAKARELISAYRDRITDAGEEEQNAIMEVLVTIGTPEALSPYFHIFRTGRMEEKQSLLARLSKKRINPEMVRTLLIQLENETEDVQYWFAELLMKAGPESIPVLKNALTTNKKTVRLWLVKIFGTMKDDSVLPVLAEFLSDEDKAIKIEAIKALLKFPGPKAREAVLRKFIAEGEETRVNIIAQSTPTKDYESLRLIGSALEKANEGDRYWLSKLLIEWSGGNTTVVEKLERECRDTGARIWLQKVLDHLRGVKYL